MSIDTLLLLQRVLYTQQLVVGDPSFPTTARVVLTALTELDTAIQEATSAPTSE